MYINNVVLFEQGCFHTIILSFKKRLLSQTTINVCNDIFLQSISSNVYGFISSMCWNIFILFFERRERLSFLLSIHFPGAFVIFMASVLKFTTGNFMWTIFIYIVQIGCFWIGFYYVRILNVFSIAIILNILNGLHQYLIQKSTYFQIENVGLLNISIRATHLMFSVVRILVKSNQILIKIGLYSFTITALLHSFILSLSKIYG